MVVSERLLILANYLGAKYCEGVNVGCFVTPYVLFCHYRTVRLPFRLTPLKRLV